MKKLLLLAAMSLFFALGLINAQEIYSENFDALNTGEGIALQVPDNWTTWTDNPGSAEDPWVSDAYSVSPSNSLLIGTGNDVVMTVGELTENRYKMSFQFYIPTGNCGFYSPMQEFNAETSTYHNGMQIFFLNGSGDIDGGGANGVASFTFDHDTWNTLEQIFDLDYETTDIFVNGQIVYSGNWSNGINYYSNTLQGFDIYGWDESATPAMYFDDIVFEQVESVNPPTNLVLQIQNDNDVLVSWDAPEVGSPDSYYITRNGEFLYEVSGATSYLDENLYPNIYDYQVKAYYGAENGYSVLTDTATIEVEGGVQRQMVLIEIFTGTECDDAGTLAMATSLFENLGLNSTVINYQSGLYETSAYNNRSAFYVPFFDSDESSDLLCPSSIVNGMIGHEGLVSNLLNQRNFFKDYTEEYLELPAIYTIEPVLDYAGSGVFNIDVDIEEVYYYYGGDMKLFVALTENGIEESWQAQSVINNMLRNMIPDDNGTLLDFSGSSVDNVSLQFTINSEYNMANCKLVFFVQNMETGYIMEVAEMSLADYVGVETNQQTKISIYPNPANDFVNVYANETITEISIMDIAGKKLLEENPNSTSVEINTNDLSSGVYLINIETLTGNTIRKIIVE